ncbi:MAG: FHA domain-containing protein [Candidatus Wallbacteria bacterium]|nr:FHA domain-containing protein [Candidatus Wallbacteria bacterium]
MAIPEAYLKHGSKRYRITKPIFSVGREAGCDILINDEQLSRKHALIAAADSRFYLIDFKSSNGVQVNGRRVEESLLNDGDKITMGAQEFIFSGPRSDIAERGKAAEKQAAGAIAGKLLSPGRDPGGDPGESLGKLLKQDTLSLLKNRQIDKADSTNKLLILYKVATVITSVLDIKELLNKVMDLALEVLYADRGFIMMPNEKGELLPVVSKSVERDAPKGAILPVSRSIAHYTYEKGDPVLTQDALIDKRFQQSGSIQMYNIRSAMSVALQTRNKRLGVLYIDNRIQSSCFNDEDLNLLIAFADMVSVAIDNSKLYHNLKASLEKIKQQQDALVMSEKMAAMGQLSAGVAHEIRNPLTAISGYTQLYFTKHTPEEFFYPKMKLVQEAANRIQRIVDSLLGFARKGERKFETVNVASVLEETLVLAEHTLSKYNKVEVVRDWDPALPPIMMDRHQMQQVFLNFMINAAQAMPSGGRLTVRTRPEKFADDPSRVSHVDILFEDTGVGIPADKQQHLFQAFATFGKKDGTGLGLWLSKSIVEQHKGTISFVSELGTGTTFCIKLPY